MIPTKEQVEALAAALRKAFPPTAWPVAPADPVDDAAAILAALDGWTLVRGPIRETVNEMQAEIERLRTANRRLMTALRVSDHKPHDQDGESIEGFPVCSVCGAIQTDLEGSDDLCMHDGIEDASDCSYRPLSLAPEVPA